MWYNISPYKDKTAGDGMKYGKWTILLSVCMFSVLCLVGCHSRSDKQVATEKPNEGITYEKGVDFVGVIKAVDTDLQMIEFYNTSFDSMETYPYTGGTQILSKNDKEMSASEMEQGDVYNVFTSEDGRKIVKLKQYENLTVYDNTAVKVDSEEKRLTIQNINYAYTDNLLVFSEGKLISPMEITSDDEVTFRGVKGQAFSLIVTRGHGYIEPKNYKDFIGGVVVLQGEAILPVSKAMLLTVPEGTQNLSMVNGDLMGEVSVEVKRGQVTEVNMADYQSQVPDTARVHFKINPEGAELYVNGALTDPSKPLSLKYGNHSIKVVLEGYNDYSGVIHVQDPSPLVKIDLAEEEATIENEDSDSSSSVSEKDTSDSSSKEDAVTYDKEHKITVSAPSGAAVYLNGTYKGEAPCSFTKAIGNVTVTLTKEGYETKSYSLQLSDDSKDITWSFPDLTKSGKG